MATSIEKKFNTAKTIEPQENIWNCYCFCITLSYYECEKPVIHCDLMPSNVLLDDEEMVAHLGDFGLARLLSLTQKQTNTSEIKRTIGYVPPGMV